MVRNFIGFIGNAEERSSEIKECVSSLEFRLVVSGFRVLETMAVKSGSAKAAFSGNQ